MLNCPASKVRPPHHSLPLLVHRHLVGMRCPLKMDGWKTILDPLGCQFFSCKLTVCFKESPSTFWLDLPSTLPRIPLTTRNQKKTHIYFGIGVRPLVHFHQGIRYVKGKQSRSHSLSVHCVQGIPINLHRIWPPTQLQWQWMVFKDSLF